MTNILVIRVVCLGKDTTLEEDVDDDMGPGESIPIMYYEQEGLVCRDVDPTLGMKEEDYLFGVKVPDYRLNSTDKNCEPERHYDE
jgi:hypothetical protein